MRTASLIELNKDKFEALKKGKLDCFNGDEVTQPKEMGFIVPLVDEYKTLQKKESKRLKNLICKKINIVFIIVIHIFLSNFKFDRN